VLFPTHLLVAALLSRASRLSMPWLVVGAAAPDVIDKPLGMVGVVELYHSVGHSVLLFAIVVPVAVSSAAGLGVAVGWASHLVADGLHVVVNGRPDALLSLGWPVVTPPDPLAIPPGAFFGYYVGSASFFLEVGLWVLGGVAVLSGSRAVSRVRGDGL
jgi:hypothetical protein